MSTRKHTIEVEVEEEISPFVMMRVGIFEHIRNGWMDADMYLVYSLMLHLCDWETGIWCGCAAKMAEQLNNIWSVKKVERILKRLADGKYIESTYRVGVSGNFDIFINNFTPTKGPNALKVKIRQVQAGNPLQTPDKSVGAVAGVGLNLSEGGSEFVGGSDKNVLGVGTNLSEGGSEFVEPPDKNVLLYNNSIKNVLQSSPQGLNVLKQQRASTPVVFDEEEA